MSNEIKFQENEEDNKLIIRISGRLDATSSPKLEKKLTQRINSGYKQLLLDFSAVEYLSSAGMRLLLSFTKKLKNEKGALVLFGLTKGIMDIIKMGGFESILDICENEKEALLNS